MLPLPSTQTGGGPDSFRYLQDRQRPHPQQRRLWKFQPQGCQRILSTLLHARPKQPPTRPQQQDERLARRAWPAAIADLLHFFPSATHLATSSLITPEAGAEAEAAAGGADSAGAAGTDVATVVAVELPPSPRSHGIGSPAFSASISVSLRRGRPFL